MIRNGQELIYFKKTDIENILKNKAAVDSKYQWILDHITDEDYRKFCNYPRKPENLEKGLYHLYENLYEKYLKEQQRQNAIKIDQYYTDKLDKYMKENLLDFDNNTCYKVYNEITKTWMYLEFYSIKIGHYETWKDIYQHNSYLEFYEFDNKYFNGQYPKMSSYITIEIEDLDNYKNWTPVPTLWDIELPHKIYKACEQANVIRLDLLKNVCIESIKGIGPKNAKVLKEALIS